MAQKARHAYGTLEGIDKALQDGVIDAYDVLFVKDADGKPYVGWIDKNGVKNIVRPEATTVVDGDSLPETGETGKIYIFNDEAYVYTGTEYKNLAQPADLSALENQVDSLSTQVAAKADTEYVSQAVDDAKKYVDEQIDAKIAEVSSVEVVEF